MLDMYINLDSARLFYRALSESALRSILTPVTQLSFFELLGGRITSDVYFFRPHLLA